MNARIQTVSAAAIANNPHRRIGAYGLRPEKVAALKRSIERVGLWEGIIVRPVSDGFECAFGHHRLAAVRDQLGEQAEISVIVRDLDDGQMLQFMANENGEEFNTDFLVMLETWEAGVAFLDRRDDQKPQVIEIASFLGWTRPQSNRENGLNISYTAEACAAAAKLIEGGRLSRDNLQGLSIRQAREVCQATVAHLETIERVAAKQIKTGDGPSARQVERVKKEYAASAKSVADDLREGRIGTKKARGEVWSRADIRVRKQNLPDFGIAVDQLVRQIERSFGEDVQQKLTTLCDAAHLVPEDERHRYRHLAYVSDELSTRATAGARKARLAADATSPTPIRVVQKEA